jgi:hypothetical protein
MPIRPNSNYESIEPRPSFTFKLACSASFLSYRNPASSGKAPGENCPGSNRCLSCQVKLTVLDSFLEALPLLAAVSRQGWSVFLL